MKDNKILNKIKLILIIFAIIGICGSIFRIMIKTNVISDKQKEFNVSDVVEHEGITFSIDEIIKDDIYQNVHAGDGFKYIIVKMRIKNDSENPFYIYDGTWMMEGESSNTGLNNSYALVEMGMDDAIVNSADEKIVEIAFEQPNGSTEKKFSYSRLPDDFNGKTFTYILSE